MLKVKMELNICSTKFIITLIIFVFIKEMFIIRVFNIDQSAMNFYLILLFEILSTGNHLLMIYCYI